MTKNSLIINRVLMGILVFNTITALAGGTALIFGVISPPHEWLQNTLFTSYLVPGLVLFFVVGGSALYGVYTIIKNKPHYKQAAGLSGLVMMMWITVEVITIRHFHWLQALYYTLGCIITVLAHPNFSNSRPPQIAKR